MSLTTTTSEGATPSARPVPLTNASAARTALELRVGDYFVGTIWQEDLFPAKYERRPIRDTNETLRAQVVDGTAVRVVFVVCGDGNSARDLMEIMCRLPNGHGHQVSTSSAMWVCGVKDKRSRKVRVLKWDTTKAPFNPEDYK
jgi:hypothetical protein